MQNAQKSGKAKEWTTTKGDRDGNGRMIACLMLGTQTVVIPSSVHPLSSVHCLCTFGYAHLVDAIHTNTLQAFIVDASVLARFAFNMHERSLNLLCTRRRGIRDKGGMMAVIAANITSG